MDTTTAAMAAKNKLETHKPQEEQQPEAPISLVSSMPIVQKTGAQEVQPAAQHPDKPKLAGKMAHAQNTKTEVAKKQAKATHVDAAILEALKTLRLDIGASLAQVKKAHRDLVRRMHPDTKGGSIEAFVKVQTAYEILTGKRSPEKTLEVFFALAITNDSVDIYQLIAMIFELMTLIFIQSLPFIIFFFTIGH